MRFKTFQEHLFTARRGSAQAIAGVVSRYQRMTPRLCVLAAVRIYNRTAASVVEPEAYALFRDAITFLVRVADGIAHEDELEVMRTRVSAARAPRRGGFSPVIRRELLRMWETLTALARASPALALGRAFDSRTAVILRRQPPPYTSYGSCTDRGVDSMDLMFETLNVLAPTWRWNPEWNTSSVVSLAEGMRESQDFSATPILADAMQESGCTDPRWLDFFRRPPIPHTRFLGLGGIEKAAGKYKRRTCDLLPVR